MSLDFIIIGAQKAATSSLHAALRAQPGIVMPSGESPFFEDPEFASFPWNTAFRGAENECLTGIKRPDILCSSMMRDRVHRTHPDAKLIVVLREPVSRAVSAYYHLVRYGGLKFRTINDGLDACLSSYRSGRSDLESSVVENGLYGKHLKEWVSLYGRENLLILSQKTVGEDPQGSLQACIRHIGGLNVETRLSFQDLGVDIGKKNVGLYDPGMLRVSNALSRLRTRPMSDGRRRLPRNIFVRAPAVGLARVAEWYSARRNLPPEDIDSGIIENLERIYFSDSKILNGLVPQDVVYWRSHAYMSGGGFS